MPPLALMPMPPAPEIATALLPPTVALLMLEAAIPFPLGLETLTASTSEPSPRSIPSPRGVW